MRSKVTNPFAFYRWAFLIFLNLSQLILSAQDSVVNPARVTHTKKEYRSQVLHDSTKKMLELKESIPGLIYDLRYAGTDNFMHRRMYPEGTSRTFMRQPAASALREVQEELKTKNLGLKIFDAYRPFSVTVKFWKLVHDERYVANPAKGSGHNRGIAVDLTVIDLATGKELDMGTGFDNFTDSAHHSFTNLPDTILNNRKMLRAIMEKHVFTAMETEWWHYFLRNGEKFEVLDVGFGEFKR